MFSCVLRQALNQQEELNLCDIQLGEEQGCD